MSEIAVFRGVLTLMQTRFNGEVKFSNTFFLQSVDAQGVTFLQPTNWTETRFARLVSFTSAKIYFRQTQLYLDIRTWESNNQPFRVLQNDT